MPAEDLPRALPLQGASNVRDLGGWRVADGRRVRFGRVYRSASLAGLTEADAAVLTAAGLRTVCDLRGTAEQQTAPSRLPGVTIHDLGIDPSLGASLSDIAATREATGEDVMVLLRRAYTAYALDWSHRYRTLFDLLLQTDAPPLLFHCTAGKDRTGFGAALLLTALGADEAVVLEDYLATNRLWRRDVVFATRLPPVVADTLLRVHPELIATSFDAIRTAHGSVDDYLEQRIGLDAARRRQLQDTLLE